MRAEARGDFILGKRTLGEAGGCFGSLSSQGKDGAAESEFRAPGMDWWGLLFLEGGVGGVALGFEPEEEVEDLGGFEAVQ
jgi:hypothetical protein